MNTEQITVTIMLGCLFILVGWDVYAAYFNDIPNERDTESGILRRAGRSFVAIPLAWGILGGHFWGPQFTWLGFWGPIVLIGIAGLLSWHHFILRRFLKIPAWFGLVYVVLGVFLGATFWPQ